ncbi:hypothetical protein [Variovorax saccharolyticus]|uniref:hypothetical protein n=1 Tax=Variovorax saccharolyticus TaxID=3053516 RepID=UPI0025756AE4|nr:hypothetical protein [Variovorax sp. J31P216]MDM0030067.1 hypothetical protein [Variovorax sp. J31P216]
MTPEVPKRLAPSTDTLRQLYLKSGNRCAFRSCDQALFTSTGAFVGEVCHIEAAGPEGERFNSNMTNEERRQYANLILLCRIHHVETNDVMTYTVEKMQKIKSDHESIFSDVIGKMRLQVVDHTSLLNPVLPGNMRKLDAFKGWTSTEEEDLENVESLSKIVDKLAKVPIPSRELFLVIVNRASQSALGWQASVAEVRQSTDLDDDNLRACCSILDKYGFISEGWPDEFNQETVRLEKNEHGWAIWPDIKAFSDKNGLDLHDMLVDLDFSSLGT